MSEVERLLKGDTAGNFGRLGRAVEDALARYDRALKQDDMQARARACHAAAHAVWLYFVQREACGLRRHEPVIESLRIPPAVLALVGAPPPTSSN